MLQARQGKQQADSYLVGLRCTGFACVRVQAGTDGSRFAKKASDSLNATGVDIPCGHLQDCYMCK